jgi:hypothetical protein
LNDVQELPLLLQFVAGLTDFDLHALGKLIQQFFVQLGFSESEELALVCLGVERLVLIPDDLFHLGVLVSEALYLGLDNLHGRQDFVVELFEIIVQGKPTLLVLELEECFQLCLVVDSAIHSSKLSSEFSKR